MLFSPHGSTVARSFESRKKQSPCSASVSLPEGVISFTKSHRWTEQNTLGGRLAKACMNVFNPRRPCFPSVSIVYLTLLLFALDTCLTSPLAFSILAANRWLVQITTAVFVPHCWVYCTVFFHHLFRFFASQPQYSPVPSDYLRPPGHASWLATFAPIHFFVLAVFSRILPWSTFAQWTTALHIPLRCHNA